jgi:hypothetical protein
MIGVGYDALCANSGRDFLETTPEKRMERIITAVYVAMRRVSER